MLSDTSLQTLVAIANVTAAISSVEEPQVKRKPQLVRLP